jgi:hypothetical protein
MPTLCDRATAQPYLKTNHSVTKAKQFRTISSQQLPRKASKPLQCPSQRHIPSKQQPHMGPPDSCLQLRPTPAFQRWRPSFRIASPGQTDDSAAALTRWPFLSSRRAAVEDIVVASSLLRNRTVMTPMTIRQTRVIRPRTLKPMITTFVSSSIVEAVQVFLLLIRLVGGKSFDQKCYA